MKTSTRSFVSTVGACGALLLISPAWSQSANVSLHAAMVKTTLVLTPVPGPLVSVSGEAGQINLQGVGSVTTSVPQQGLSVLGMQMATVANGNATATACSNGSCNSIVNVEFALGDTQIDAHLGRISLLDGLVTFTQSNSFEAIISPNSPAIRMVNFEAPVTTSSGTRSVASHCPSQPGDTPPGTQIPVDGPVTQTLLDAVGAVTGTQALQFRGQVTVNDPCVATTTASGGTQFAPISLTGTLSGLFGLFGQKYADIREDVGVIQLSP